MNQIHPQDFSSQKEKEKKRIHPVNGGRRRIRSSAIRSRDFFPRVQPALGDCRRRMTAQVILSIPTSKNYLPVGKAGRANPANKWSRRSQISIVHVLCWIYLYEAPAGNAPVKAYGDTFHARHGTFTSSSFTNHSLDRVTSYRLDRDV